MGWADCGKDSRGRNIGYAFPARCDEPNCFVRIHRGLSFACGGMHRADVDQCEGYFCSKHLNWTENMSHPICKRCLITNECEEESK